MASMTGLWCYLSREFPPKMWRVPTKYLAVALLGAAVLCKSSGALGLLMLGLFVLVVSSRLKWRFLAWLLLLIPVAYIGTRSTGNWDGKSLVDAVSRHVSPDRAESLEFRFENEDILVEKALQRPIFGWGGWGRARVYDEEGKDISTTDGLWVITLGNYGFYGLVSLTAALLLPMFLLLSRCPPALWSRPGYGALAVMAFVSMLFTVDCLLNAMINPVYVLFSGGVSGALALNRKWTVEVLEENRSVRHEDGSRLPGVAPGDEPMSEAPYAGTFRQISALSGVRTGLVSPGETLRRGALVKTRIQGGAEGLRRFRMVGERRQFLRHLAEPSQVLSEEE
jgi:hypothetical protein